MNKTDYSIIGEYGGTIETNNPGNWWTLDLEVEQCYDDKKDILIGVFKVVNGDIMYDPAAKLTLTMQEGQIKNLVVHELSNTTVFGTSWIDENDMFHFWDTEEKYPYKLIDCFEEFMNNIVVHGPYLSDPKTVKRYDKALAD